MVYAVRIHGTAAWQVYGRFQEYAEFVYRKSKSFRLNNTACLTISLVHMGAGKSAATMIWTLPSTTSCSVTASQPCLMIKSTRCMRRSQCLRKAGSMPNGETATSSPLQQKSYTRADAPSVVWPERHRDCALGVACCVDLERFIHVRQHRRSGMLIRHHMTGIQFDRK